MEAVQSELLTESLKFYVGYFTAVSILHYKHRMAEQINDELEKIWTETAVTLSRNHPDICLEGMRETRMNLIHNSHYTCRDSNYIHPEYESGSKQEETYNSKHFLNSSHCIPKFLFPQKLT